MAASRPRFRSSIQQVSASRARSTGCFARSAISASTSIGGPRKSAGIVVRCPSANTTIAPNGSFGEAIDRDDAARRR